MNYNDTVAAVQSGATASCPEWGTYPYNSYIIYLAGQIYFVTTTSATIWGPTDADKERTDYYTDGDGDRPPKRN